MIFRNDINGLRAIAVVAVMLFHFNPEWVPGGFAGVDVFFVISGFLMTGIIFRGFEKDNFSILKFYIARASRIIPALIALCAFLLIIGWFVLTPADYRNLGINSAASSIFISNIIYWLESGYFAPGVENNLLLHTWSLSVEWQFYLIYPVILVFLSKIFSINLIKKLLVIATVVGFGYALYASMNSPSSAYYLLPSRFWEMCIGGLAYLYPINITHKKRVEGVGLLLILASVFIVSETDLWPGYMSLLPVIGTYLVIISNAGSSFITTNRVSLFIGKISYSVYLWHWPVHVYLYKNEYENLYTNVLGIIASIVIGYISYLLFEQKRFVFGDIKIANLFKYKPLLYSAFVFVISAGIYKSDGLVNYSYLMNPQALDYISQYENYMEKSEVKAKYHVSYIQDRFNPSPNLGKNDGVFLWGDSHANAMVYGLETIFREQNIKFQATFDSGCSAGIGIGVNKKKKGTRDYNKCVQNNDFALDFIKKNKPKVVIFAQYKEHDLNDFEKIIEVIADPNIQFIIVGPVPQWRGTLPSRIAYQSLDSSDVYMNNIRPWLIPMDKKMQEKYKDSNIQYISILNTLCIDDNKCLAKVDDKNHALAWDYGHLSLEGSFYVGKNIIFPRILPYINLPQVTRVPSN